MPLRSQTLELAVLGRLAQGPGHGYALRKYLVAVLGALHSISYGSLYPALRRLSERGLICDCGSGPARLTGRARRSYHITPSGQQYLIEQLAVADESAWADDDFGVRFSLLGAADRQTRLGVLRGRRAQTAARQAALREAVVTDFDRYTQELVRHAGETIAVELDWLDRQIAAEQGAEPGVRYVKENT